VDHAALDAYVRAVRTGSRLPRDRPARPDAMEVTARQVLWHRIREQRLAERQADVVAAAFGGLQDTAPRAALLSLHARLTTTGPDTWEAPELVQVWFRGSDYVIPRADVALFTVGASPRDASQRAALDDLASAALDVLDGRPRPTREVYEALGLMHPMELRIMAVTGRVHIRWDASTIDLIPADRPGADAEEVRLALARRFLDWLGPASCAQFAKWAALSRDDADATWKAIESEVVSVSLDGAERWLLGVGADPTSAPRPEGVRFLPMGDPLLSIDTARLLPADRLPLPPVGPTVTQRVLNSLAGTVVLDGDLVAAWGRVQGKVSIAAWRHLNRREVERIEAEAVTMAGPIGRDIDVRWL
jgi:hypothetical protein